MRRLLLPCHLIACLTALLAAPAANGAFGFEALDVEILNADGSPATQAGSHPFAMTTTVDFNVDSETGQPEESVKDLLVDLPPGLVGDPTAVPRCSNEDFLTLRDSGPLALTPSCSNASAVGFIAARAANTPPPGEFAVAYNLAPPPGVAASGC
jgi:hypothetical protein